jgi:histidyl-tRNA synthetase
MASRDLEPTPNLAAPRARPVERVRGMHDRLARDAVAQRALLERLHECAEAHGYDLVDPPVLEHTDLFLRKSGGDRVAQMYAFEHRGRSLALRPEFTAAAVRVFVEHLQAEPLPARMRFSGPVFRYEKPQAGRARQFTEFGCELIGASGPVADAEIVALALEGLATAGVARPRLVLGHIGVVISLLAGMDIDERAQDWLTWSMERLRKGDDAAHDLPPHLARLEASLEDDAALPAIDDGVSPAAAAAILRQAGVEFQGGVRTPEDIVRGIFVRRRRRHDARLLRDAAEFVTRLTALSGPPAEVLAPLRDLVTARGLDAAPLDELEQVIELLAATDHEADVRIDLGMGRGLHYYTGMLFEIYAADGRGPQLCGGGRYDDLAQILGARSPVPACGFSYGIERVLAAGALPADGETARPRVLVLQDDDAARAMRLAAALRARGWVASLDVRDRNRTATERAAQRQGYMALARAVDSGAELMMLDDGSTRGYAAAPAPDEVM